MKITDNMNLEELAKQAIPEHKYPDMEYPASVVTKFKRDSWVDGYKAALQQLGNQATLVVSTQEPLVTPQMEAFWKTHPLTFDAWIYEHRAHGERVPAIRAGWGECFALLTKDYAYAKEHYDEKVTVRPVPEYYMTVEIINP